VIAPVLVRDFLSESAPRITEVAPSTRRLCAMIHEIGETQR